MHAQVIHLAMFALCLSFLQVIHKAIEAGCMLDTSDIYGPFKNEELIGMSRNGTCRWLQAATYIYAHIASHLRPSWITAGRAIAGLPRDKITIATKFGIFFNNHREWKMSVDGSRKHARYLQGFVCFSALFGALPSYRGRC